MPNKRASRNAYFFFVLDMIPELRRRGFRVSGVKEAIPLCSGDWALLSAEEREKYAEKAKEWKGRELDPPIPSANHQEKELKSNYQVGGEQRGPDWFSKGREDLDKCVIYIINIFSHGEMPSVCEQRYVPCEIGCVRYSLQNGIMDSFHLFIDPGELPLGFRYHCQAGSAATHQIPVSGFQLANRDYHNLFRSLCDFVCPAAKRCTSVYCRSNDIHRIKWSLNWLAVKAGMENLFELQDIESLIIKFYKDKLDEEPSKSSVQRLLDVVQWDYANNTSYCISRALSSVYGVVLTSAHLPNLQANNKQKCESSETIVLDAKRYQMKTDRPRQTGSGNSVGAVGGEHFLGMRGVGSTPTSKVRGRGILRLLEEMPAPYATSG